MTRTQLLKVAWQIISNPVEKYADRAGYGDIYTGLYMKRPMSVFLTNDENIIAVSYNKVCYFINGTDRKTAPRVVSFCDEHSCKERVYLYPEAKKILTDEDGNIDNPTDRRISHHFDYSDVIPIKYQA